MQNAIPKPLWFIVSIFLIFVVAGCTPIVAPTTEPSSAAASGTSSGSVTRSAGETLLTWQGHTEMIDGDLTQCKMLTIDAGNVVRYGLCGDSVSLTIAEGYLPLHWAEIQARFAPFTLESEQEKVSFQGSGEIEGEAWQRAIILYARTSYGEAATGRVGASVHTAMSWWLSELPEQPGFCPHFVLLNYGYAYISVEPCAGGEATIRAEGWLESSEWKALDHWLYSSAPLYQENNYFAALGTKEMSAAEVADLVQWVEATYRRMAEALPGFIE